MCMTTDPIRPAPHIDLHFRAAAARAGIINCLWWYTVGSWINHFDWQLHGKTFICPIERFFQTNPLPLIQGGNDHLHGDYCCYYYGRLFCLLQAGQTSECKLSKWPKKSGNDFSAKVLRKFTEINWPTRRIVEPAFFLICFSKSWYGWSVGRSLSGRSGGSVIFGRWSSILVDTSESVPPHMWMNTNGSGLQCMDSGFWGCEDEYILRTF